MNFIKVILIGGSLFILGFSLGFMVTKSVSNSKLAINSISSEELQNSNIDQYLRANNWILEKLSCETHSMSNIFTCNNSIIVTDNFMQVTIGDIIIYNNMDKRIIHQIIAQIGDCYLAKGVNNWIPDFQCIKREDITSKVIGVFYT